MAGLGETLGSPWPPLDIRSCPYHKRKHLLYFSHFSYYGLVFKVAMTDKIDLLLLLRFL
jgi:hypothetical protein